MRALRSLRCHAGSGPLYLDLLRSVATVVEGGTNEKQVGREEKNPKPSVQNATLASHAQGAIPEKTVQGVQVREPGATPVESAVREDVVVDRRRGNATCNSWRADRSRAGSGTEASCSTLQPRAETPIEPTLGYWDTIPHTKQSTGPAGAGLGPARAWQWMYLCSLREPYGGPMEGGLTSDAPGGALLSRGRSTYPEAPM